MFLDVVSLPNGIHKPELRPLDPINKARRQVSIYKWNYPNQSTAKGSQ